MKTINISVNWNNADSITEAEKTKERLENKGYKVVNEFGGMVHTTIVMGKIK